MNAPRARTPAALAATLVAALAAPHAAHACAVCSLFSNEANRKAFFDTTILLSLLPLGLLVGGVIWFARSAGVSLSDELRESDEDAPPATLTGEAPKP